MATGPNAIVEFPSAAFVREQRFNEFDRLFEGNGVAQDEIAHALQAIYTQSDLASECLALLPMSVSMRIDFAPRLVKLLESLHETKEHFKGRLKKSIHFAEHIDETLNRHTSGHLPDCVLPVDLEDLNHQWTALDAANREALRSSRPTIEDLTSNVSVLKELCSFLAKISNEQTNLKSALMKVQSFGNCRAGEIASPHLLQRQMQLLTGEMDRHSNWLGAVRVHCENLIKKYIDDELSLAELQATLVQHRSELNRLIEQGNCELKFVPVLSDPSLFHPAVVDCCLAVCERIDSFLIDFDRTLPLIEQRVGKLRMQVLNAQAKGHCAAGNDQFVNSVIQMADSFIPKLRAVKQEVARHLWAIKAEVVDVSSPSESQNALLMRLFRQTADKIDQLNLHFNDNLNRLQSKLDEASSRLGGAVV